MVNPALTDTQDVGPELNVQSTCVDQGVLELWKQQLCENESPYGVERGRIPEPNHRDLVPEIHLSPVLCGRLLTVCGLCSSSPRLFSHLATPPMLTHLSHTPTSPALSLFSFSPVTPAAPASYSQPDHFHQAL